MESFEALDAALAAHMESLIALAVFAASAWVRRHFQGRAALEAVVEVEREHRDRKSPGSERPPMTGPQRKEVAKMRVAKKLPRLLRPLTDDGMGKLVERHVRRAHEVVDDHLAEEVRGGS